MVLGAAFKDIHFIVIKVSDSYSAPSFPATPCKRHLGEKAEKVSASKRILPSAYQSHSIRNLFVRRRVHT